MGDEPTNSQRILRRSVLPLICAVAIAAAGAGVVAGGLLSQRGYLFARKVGLGIPATTPLFRVGRVVYSLGNLPEGDRIQYSSVTDSFRRQIYDISVALLQRYAAGAKGVPEAAPVPPASAVKAYFERNKTQMFPGRKFDEVRGMATSMMVSDMIREREKKRLSELLKSNKAALFLENPAGKEGPH